MSVQVCESGVTFGDFGAADVFLVEQAVAQVQLSNAGVKSVEFILRQEVSGTAVINLVEAKSSLPRDSTAFFGDIRQKMLHSLAVWFCAVVGRHAALKPLLPEHQRSIKVLNLPLRLVLVVPKAPDASLPQLTDLFRRAMVADRTSWAIDHSAILVLNESRAIKYGLIAQVVT